MKTYGIIGSGKCGENIIEDGLAELSEGAHFFVYGRKGASSNEDRVYDYLLENEIPFTLFVDYNATVPKVLTESATKVVTVTPSGTAYASIITELAKESGELLVLWDDAVADILQDNVFLAHDKKVIAKELSNGLIPINVSDNAPQEEGPTMEPFSEDELRSMSIGVLRKAAAARGIENSTDYDKDELIALITGGPMPITTSATPMTAEVTVETHVNKEYTLSVERGSYQTPEGDCVVNVVFPNGTVVTTSATTEEVRSLLGLG